MARYVLDAKRVAASLKVLRGLYIHPHFAAYLALKRASVTLGRATDLPLNYDEFWEAFFRVGKANPKKPYLRPFLDEKPSEKNLLLNKNVAGSYAFSSYRRTLLLVVDGKEGKVKNRTVHTYSFKPKHWQLARQYLLKDGQVPIADLVTFLYRDYALETDAEIPSVADWIAVFRGEFGYKQSGSTGTNAEFDELFRDDGVAREGVEWFQPVT